jgi:hypothetical protein
VTWAMIRWVTAFRVCGSGVCGTMLIMAGGLDFPAASPRDETGSR